MVKGYWWWEGGGQCNYYVCPSPKNCIFILGLDQVRIRGLLGQGIGDLDLGLTIDKIDRKKQKKSPGKLKKNYQNERKL